MTVTEYENIPGTDDNFNFPPEVRTAFANSSELIAKISALIAANPDVISAAVAQAQTGTGLIPKWKASTNYTTGQWAVNLRGNIMSSNNDHTSPSTFTAAEEANWTIYNTMSRGRMAVGADLDTFRTPGVWIIHNQTTADSIVNWPAGLSRAPGIFQVLGEPNSTFGSTIVFGHVLWTYGAATQGKRERIATGSTVWGNWVDPYLLGTSSIGIPSDYALSHIAFREALTRRRGGEIGTNGLAGVSIRLDHGAVNAKDYIIPKLLELGLPWSWAINPGATRLALPENGNIPWTEYQDINKNKGGEILDHGMDHIDAPDTASMLVQLVDSKAALQTNIPMQAIEVFAVPGVSGTDMNGWTATNTPAHFTSQYEAARHVLGSHGGCTGYTPGYYRDLDGRMSNGETHQTMDSTILASEITAKIQAAQLIGAGLQLMLHPSLVNQTDKITSTVLHEILDYIAAERDAGRLVVLTATGLMMANSRSAFRHNLLKNPDLQTTAGWATGGYSGFAGSAISTTTAGQMSQTIDLTNRAQFAGAHREVVATFKADASGAIARLRFQHTAAGIDITKDVTLSPNETQTVRFIALMPILSGTNAPTFSAGRLSGGSVTVTKPGVLAV